MNNRYGMPQHIPNRSTRINSVKAIPIAHKAPCHQIEFWSSQNSNNRRMKTTYKINAILFAGCSKGDTYEYYKNLFNLLTVPRNPEVSANK